MCGKKQKPQGETEGQKETAKIGAEKWNYYQQHLVPFENQFIDRAHVKGHEMDRAEGMANVDTQSAFGNQPDVTGGAQRGGSLAMRMASGALRKARAVGSSMVRAGSNTEDRKVQGLQSIIAAGTGQKIEAQQGVLKNAANNFNTSLNEARVNAQDDFAQSSAMMQAAGMAAGAYTNMPEKPPMPGGNDASIYDPVNTA